MKKVLSLALLMLFSLVFTGCGGGSSTTTTSTVTGVFYDAPVKGLGYTCSSGSQGTTDVKGEYTCNTGDNVTFFIGSVAIGTIAAQSAIITPYSLFPNNNTAALNLARLLQSLDTSPNPNLIDLNTTLAGSIPVEIDFSEDSFETDVQTALGIILISSSEAQTAMNDAIVSVGGSVPTDLNHIPVVNAGTNQTVQVNQSITITGTGTDSDGSIVSYEWKKGSSVLATTAAFTYTPSTVGTDTLTLTVADNDGATASASINVTVTPVADTANFAPVANAGTNQTVEVNQSITITGIATDSDGTIASYQWTKGSTVLATTASFTYTPGAVGTDTLTLTVTDNDGATASASIDLEVLRHNVNFVLFDYHGWGLADVSFWYLGNDKWERLDEYTCVSFTETGREGSSIFLRDSTGTENLTINLEAKTITSDQNSEILTVIEFGIRERGEVNVMCPSTSNDYIPAITSTAVVEINAARTMVLTLKASDADLPAEDLSFTLTDNPKTDNNLFKISSFSEQARAACRGNISGVDKDYLDYYIVQDGVNSLEECQAACSEYPLNGGTASCKGVEYRIEGADSIYPDARCELWKAPILATVPHPAYSCHIRSSERANVLSFNNAPDFRIPLDIDANNVYEVEVEVADGVNSSTQIILVTVVPNGDYIGRSGTACRAGTQNEGHPEDPDNADYFTITNDVKSLEDCQALCDAYPLSADPSVNCFGVEYRVEGADYADLKSRCELWKVPIVATTPQKEYACYVRDLKRDKYGPVTDTYLGTYKASGVSYADNVEGDFFTKTMTLTKLSENELLWTEAEGKYWTVTRTAERNKLSMGGDSPYVAEVFWDADEIAGITGPDGLIYRTDWANAKLSQTQVLYQRYIDNHSSELIKVEEAQRLIRELKWAIAEKLNRPQGYRDYIADVEEMGFYGRKDEAVRRIASFKAFVTAEVLSIEVDENVPAIGENNDLELFYALEFTKDDGRPRPDETGWNTGDLILESVLQSNGSKITNINDGVDRAFIPTVAEKTLETNEAQSLRYGGLMFEEDSSATNFNRPDCEDFDQSGSCKEPGLEAEQFYSYTSSYTGNATYPRIDGIFDDYHWAQFGQRTWAGNVATATESLNSTYFTIALADMEYEVPKVETKSITFSWDEEIRLTYKLTKRNEEQYAEYLATSVVDCSAKPLKPEKLTPRSAISMEGPGFIIRNETDQTYSISLNQVGPLYYGEVPPGKIFSRDTAWGHFTIDAVLNLTGEQLYDNWDVAGPIAQFTAETLLTVFTGGSAITSLKGAITSAAGAALEAGAGVASRAGAAALGRSAFGRAMIRAGQTALSRATIKGTSTKLILKNTAGVAKNLALDTALNEAFANDLEAYIFRKEATGEYRTWRHSGFYGSTVQMYHLVGGTRLACVNDEDDIEINAPKLQILNDEECAARPDICTMY